ncbi:hypothetical protein BJF87_22600 [Gordonia sp. CNJ-863]|uniref:hypothetical protein n=1 Tax=Gordonia sp. CNJ-863 TaxID=1904963 RepID=UPI000962A8ED|nr:hypothetical protein [Gordonia sp. CNJ-863]OLT46408.1 hypothetical protein BJF87_22600 [Gordonia sp. CNJ-863]
MSRDTIVLWVISLVLFAGTAFFPAVKLASLRHTVWWQRLGWPSLLCLATYTLIPLWVYMIPSAAWIPLATCLALNAIRLAVAHRSEREEAARNRGLGIPAHRYLRSTNGVILAGALLAALAVLVVAFALDPRQPSGGLVWTAAAVAIAGTLSYFYRLLRRHHEIITIAQHRATYLAATAKPTATAGRTPQ